MNRREFLQRSALTAGAVVLGSSSAQTNSGVHKFKIGALDAMVLQDGSSRLSSAHPMFGGLNATAGEVETVLREAGVRGGLEISRNVLLVRDGADTIIFDTGLGQDLLPNLRRAGIAPEAITGVIVSHVHYGHHNGLVAGGRVSFSNAQVFVPNAELEANPASEITAYGNRVQRLERGARISPSIKYLDTSGHTVAHQGLEVVSGGQKLVCVVDAVYNQVISLRRPEWSFQFDADQEAAARSRRRLLEMTALDNALVHGYHFPFPGLGRIRKDGAGFAFSVM
jgi:glyoxylase-like metal-dependent hydrolase (beta-lactamase superfamily II)